MLEAISKMFDSTFPASFINFSFLPKYASYFVDGVLNTLALSIVAVLLAGNVESNIFEMASSMAGLLYVVTVGMT